MPHPIALDTSLDVNAKIIETTNPRALKIHQGKAARSAAFFFLFWFQFEPVCAIHPENH